MIAIYEQELYNVWLQFDLLVFGSSDYADPPEGWPSPEDAVPWEQAAVDGEVTLTPVGADPAKNPDMIADGYTIKEYYRDARGQKWSLFRNPTTDRWKGAKPSSGQD